MKLQIFFPFLRWLPDLRHGPNLRSDITAGLSVAMLLIPQSMAYAKLAGLPAYYGLYAAFIPPIIAALFGSSHILSTGPVAITSLMTGAALEPLIASGSSGYITYVVLISFMAGVIQCILGLFRLGVVLNFISYPVLLGFSNAAALIIATAQLSSLLGVPSVSYERHYQVVWHVLLDATSQTHWPTVGIALIALLTIFIFKKYWPNAPRILFAVIITTLISWLLGYEQSKTITIDDIVNYPMRQIISSYQNYPKEFEALNKKVQTTMEQLEESIKEAGETAEKTAQAMNALSQAKWELERRMIRHNLDEAQIKRFRLQKLTTKEQKTVYFNERQITPIGKVSATRWRIANIKDGKITIQAGGKIVGAIPQGLPEFQAPAFEGDMIRKLFLAALVISLIGFMEATTITRYLAAQSKETLNVNQELVGQGFAKIVGSFFQSMPVSGAFSRTVVNFNSGAKTGFSSVVAGFVVMIVLLWLTPLFYYLPITTLAVVVIIAAIGLLNFQGMFYIFKINISEGTVSLLTFIFTLIFAPKLEYAVLLGMLMALGVYLNETRRPSFIELTRDAEGNFVHAQKEDETCYLISLVRLGGSLYFANAGYFENKILKLIKKKPKLRYLIIDCMSINKIDASGVETLKSLYKRLDEAGIEIWFTRFRQTVFSVLKNSGLFDQLGEHHFYKNNEQALDVLSDYLGAKHMKNCPLASQKEN